MRHSSTNGAKKGAGKVKNALIQLGNLSGFSQASLWSWVGSRFLWQIRTGSSVVQRWLWWIPAGLGTNLGLFPLKQDPRSESGVQSWNWGCDYTCSVPGLCSQSWLEWDMFESPFWLLTPQHADGNILWKTLQCSRTDWGPHLRWHKANHPNVIGQLNSPCSVSVRVMLPGWL